jgi:hypothetical protein
MSLVTSSAAFRTLYPGNDMQLAAQSVNGFMFGLGGSPGVLQATLTSTDISGQPVGSVANDVIGGVGHTLTGDTSAMSAGSIRYAMEVTTTTPMLVVNRGSSAGSSSLAQLQQDFGSTIATLSDVSYLSGMSVSALLSSTRKSTELFVRPPLWWWAHMGRGKCSVIPAIPVAPSSIGIGTCFCRYHHIVSWQSNAKSSSGGGPSWYRNRFALPPSSFIDLT